MGRSVQGPGALSRLDPKRENRCRPNERISMGHDPIIKRQKVREDRRKHRVSSMITSKRLVALRKVSALRCKQAMGMASESETREMRQLDSPKARRLYCNRTRTFILTPHRTTTLIFMFSLSDLGTRTAMPFYSQVLIPSLLK